MSRVTTVVRRCAIALVSLVLLSTVMAPVGGAEGPVPDPPGGVGGSGVFSDINGHWARQEIETAVSTGLVRGYPNGTFRPDAPVTRAEAIALLVRTLQGSGRLPKVTPPADLVTQAMPDTRDHWATTQGVLPLAFATPLLTLDDRRADGGFAPDVDATRADAAVWLARAARPALSARLGVLQQRITGGWSAEAQAAVRTGLEDTAWPFGDTVADTLKPYVLQAYASGLVVGFPDGSFGALKPVTRAEMVMMLQRLTQAVSVTGGTQEVPVPATPEHGRVVEADLTWPSPTATPRPLRGDQAEDWPALNRLIAALRQTSEADPPAGVGDLPVTPPHSVILAIQHADGTVDTLTDAVRCETGPSGVLRCMPEPDWLILNGQLVYSPSLWDYYHGQLRLDMPLLPQAQE